MTNLFGYRLEPDFDIARERRQRLAGLTMLGGAVLWGLYLFSGYRFATELFQGWVATAALFGFTFYANRRNELHFLWLWKGVLIIVPLHVLYLIAIFWSDRTFPEIMTKAFAFTPILTIGFAFESMLSDRILDYFKPVSASGASS